MGAPKKISQDELEALEGTQDENVVETTISAPEMNEFGEVISPLSNIITTVFEIETKAEVVTEDNTEE